MLDTPNPLPRSLTLALKLGRRREDPMGRLLDRPFETVDEDFDEFSLDDLHRQAGAGRIDVADL